MIALGMRLDITGQRKTELTIQTIVAVTRIHLLKAVKHMQRSNRRRRMRSSRLIHLRSNKRFERDAPPASFACYLRAPQA